MAGFFNFYNFDKEGPGVEKDAPKKKTFFVFFETFFSNFWKFIPINVVYSLISLPLFTNGLASAGLTNVTRNTARDKHSFGLSDFFETVKKNFKQALIAGIINIFVFAVLIYDVYFFYKMPGQVMANLGFGLSLTMLVIFIMMNFYIWTLMITFKFSIKQIYSNSFKFVFINLKLNLLCLFSLAVVYGINVGLVFLFSDFFYLVVTLEVLIYLMTYPAFRFLLVQYCIFPSVKKYIIDPYYKEHPGEDIEKRRDLGIEIEETATKTDGNDGTEDDTSVFKD